MIKQSDIAKKLGVNRSTVSLALRNAPRISQGMKDKVRRMAQEMGYFQNPHLSAFMSEIRTGKVLGTKENIAVLVELSSMEEWRPWFPYRNAMIKRSREIDVALDFFFMGAPEMNWRKVNRILKSRGVKGVIMAAPYSDGSGMPSNVKDYVCVGTGFGWLRHRLEVVAWDHRHDVTLAFAELLKLGYRRIGMILNSLYVVGRCGGTEWYEGYLSCQARLPEGARIPIMAGVEHTTLREWYDRWRPDAMISVGGVLDPAKLNLAIPDQMGFATLSRMPGQTVAGVGEGEYSVGRAVVDAVVARIFHGEYGCMLASKRTAIGGIWASGDTVKVQPAAREPQPQWVIDFLDVAGAGVR